MSFMRRFLLPLAVALASGMCPCPVQAQKNVFLLERASQRASASLFSARLLQETSFLRSFSVQAAAASRVLGGKPAGVLSPMRVDISRAALRKSLQQKINVFPNKNKIDAVIFDLDGTLLDSLSAWDNSGVNFLRSRGIEPPPGLQEKLVKMSLMDGARYIKNTYGFAEPAEELLRQTLQPIRARYYRDIQPKPGIVQAVHFLRAQGVKLCVATASDRKLTEAALKRLGLLDAFDFIITCDEAGAGKQSPAVYEEALKKLGTSKKRTLVVEDALYALRTAQKAGFITAAAADAHSAADQVNLFKEADYYILSFSEVEFK